MAILMSYVCLMFSPQMIFYIRLVQYFKFYRTFFLKGAGVCAKWRAIGNPKDVPMVKRMGEIFSHERENAHRHSIYFDEIRRIRISSSNIAQNLSWRASQLV